MEYGPVLGTHSCCGSLLLHSSSIFRPSVRSVTQDRRNQGAGGAFAPSPHILAEQLTLFQQVGGWVGEKIIPTTLLFALIPSSFQTFSWL